MVQMFVLKRHLICDCRPDCRACSCRPPRPARRRCPATAPVKTAAGRIPEALPLHPARVSPGRRALARPGDLHLLHEADEPQPPKPRTSAGLPTTSRKSSTTSTGCLKTGFLDDLWVERIDEPYENGTPAKHIVYHLEERPRLKVVDYTGSKEVEISKIEDALKTAGIDGQVRHVRGRGDHPEGHGHHQGPVRRIAATTTPPSTWRRRRCRADRSCCT